MMLRTKTVNTYAGELVAWHIWPGSGLTCQKWWKGWQEQRMVSATARYVTNRMPYPIFTRISRWLIPVLPKNISEM